MPTQVPLNPLILSKFVLWVVVVAISTVLLTKRQVTSKLRVAFLIGGVLVFGLLYGLLLDKGTNPNPVLSVRNLLSSLLIKHRLVVPVAAMLIALLLMVLVSNKSICGWGCQLGLLQDLLYSVPLPKWNPPFWMSNVVRILAFIALVVGLAMVGFDWIEAIDPFQVFAFNFGVGVVLFSAVILLLSLVIYRPWCRFLCPFGLVGWGVEQVSLWRPRINRDACRGCQACVRACPTQAMADRFAGKRIVADCFACGACVDACPFDDTLSWSLPRKK